MPPMLSYPRRLQSGHFTCYLNRTYHVLTTRKFMRLDNGSFCAHCCRHFCGEPLPSPSVLPFLGSGFRSRIWALQVQVHQEVRHGAYRCASGVWRAEPLWACPRWRRINTNATKSTTLTEVREENIMRQNEKFFALFLLMAMGAASRRAQALNLTVNCDRHESLHKALRLLATTNPQGPNKITVLGSCKGNFVIQSMDRLTLITKTGASITDRSNGNLAVVDVEDSRSVTVQGFTINGGGAGVNCGSASVCYLTGNTIQSGAGSGVGVGRGSHAFLESKVIQNYNGGRGATVDDGSQMLRRKYI